MEFILNSDWVLIKEFDELKSLDSYLKKNLPGTFIRSSRDVKCSFNTNKEIHLMKHKTKLNKNQNFMRFSNQYYFIRCEKCNKAKLFRRCVENNTKITKKEFLRSNKLIFFFCFFLIITLYLMSILIK